MTKKARKAAEKPSRSAGRTVGKEDPAFYEALARAIKVARAQFGMERKDLADRANVSYAYLSDIETGRGRPGSRSLLSIAEALGRTPSELMLEAEMYGTQMRDEPSPDTTPVSGGEAKTGRATPGLIERPWFNEETLAAGLPSASRRSQREVWRSRLAATELDARTELHVLVDRLSREDVDTVLALVRRIASPSE
jgi:transcriptional regulator with XRE-family HTH domain